MAKLLKRRSVIVSALGSGLLVAAAPALAKLVTTAPQSEGPFYPRPFERFDDIDNDLVNITGKQRNSGGEILHLSGQIVSAEGDALPQALVEIWQCDVNGRYMHTGDRSPTRRRDLAFQGYGKTVTDVKGNYKFRTIRPVPYPGRTPHIHFKVSLATGRVLTTQMYIDAEPLNGRDFLYNRLSGSQQRTLTIPIIKQGENELTGSFDIVL